MRRSLFLQNIPKNLKIRPSLDDVERISHGQPALKRGVGNRNIPHRINENERKEFEQAKIRKFLLINGTGYRKERKGSPLVNSYLNFCDSLAIPSVTVFKGLGQDKLHNLVVMNLTPLRQLHNHQEIANEFYDKAHQFSSLIDIESYQQDIYHFLKDPKFNAMLKNYPIWEYPEISLSAAFSDRIESRKFAQALVETIIEPKHNDYILSQDNDYSQLEYPEA